MARNITVNHQITLVTEECVTCGVTFAIPEQLRQQLLIKREQRSFFCPNGHSQCYTGKSDADRAKELEKQIELERNGRRMLRDQLEASERSKSSLKGVITKMKKRTHHGVCLYCNRTFQNLADHMSTEHNEQLENE